MTLTLELTPEQETKLRAQAEALELTPDAYLLRMAGLEDGKNAANGSQPDAQADVTPEEHGPYYNPAFAGKTLADVLAGRIGTVSSAERNGGQVSRLSEDTGKTFTEYLLEKRRQGRL